MRVAYFVSRFPHISETFIVRELNAVQESGRVEVELFSLFPPSNPVVHPAAESWVGRVHRPSAAVGALGLLWALLRRPLRTTATAAIVLRGYARSLPRLVRAGVVIPIACAHARMVRRLGVEHIHAHYATYPALAAWICHRLVGVTYSFTAHAHDLFLDQSMLTRKVEDSAFVVAISDFNRRFLSGYGGGRQTPVEVVHCGINPADFPFRARGVPSSGPVRALCVANLTDYKGHRVLIEALARGGGRLARLELDLVGSGPLEGALKAEAARLGVAERVRFHGGMTEPQVREMLAATDLFVLASLVTPAGRMDGLPVVLMEALASGVPVVATRLSGIPELVRDGATGILAEPNDPDSLCEALVQVAADDLRLDPEAGRRLVESEFDVRRSADRLEELFLRCGS